MKKQENPNVWWLFNSLMMWGAVLGWLIGSLAVDIQETWMYQGPGIILDKEEGKLVSAKKITRYQYGRDGFLLFLGLVIWITIANNAKKDAIERAANKDYLDAKTETIVAYHVAFAKVMGDAAYQSAAAEAMKDPAYQAAKATEEAKNRVYYVASKAAKGDE